MANATCIKTEQMDNAIYLEYKINKTIKTVSIPKGARDYHFAAQLKPGTKFVITNKISHITPNDKIEINPTDCPLPYITKIIESR